VGRHLDWNSLSAAYEAVEKIGEQSDKRIKNIAATRERLEKGPAMETSVDRSRRKMLDGGEANIKVHVRRKVRGHRLLSP